MARLLRSLGVRFGALAALLAPPLAPSEPAGAGSSCRTPAWAEAVARLPPGTGEVSGLVSSGRHDGVGWMIRDSGHPASLYALHFRKGKARVREVKVAGARNTDWEDLAYSVGADGRGRLWIVESSQSRRDPYIYEVPEPDPYRDDRVPLHRRYRYRYPDRRFENTEASFMYKGDLVLVTKTAPARVYRFGSLSSKGVNRPDYVGELKGANRVSLARLSPDRSLLVTSSHDTLTVFKGNGPGSHLSDFTDSRPHRSREIARGDNIEAGDYFPSGSCDVVMLSERRNVYRLRPR